MPRNRDSGLDLMRFTALVLMVFAHFPSSSASPFISAVYFVGSSAPAFFYFAFGITFDRFARRPANVKFRMTVSFLVVAVLLNLTFSGKYLYNEFFFFLWLSQCVMAAILSWVRRPASFMLASLAGIFTCMIVAPHGFLSNAFSTIVKGNFPFLPWFVFVLAGYLFALRPMPRVPVAIALVAGSVLLHASGIRNLAIEKYPISATYVMLFAGAAIAIHALGGRIPALSRNRFVVFISENLMLATILHYVTFDVLLAVLYPIKHLAGLNLLSSHPALSLVIGPLACVAILAALLRIALRLWSTMTRNSFIRSKVIPNSLAVALAMILLYHALSSLPGAAEAVVTRFVMIAGMAYFGFVTREASKVEWMEDDFIYSRALRLTHRSVQAT